MEQFHFTSHFPFSPLPNCDCLKASFVIPLFSLPQRVETHLREPSTLCWISILPNWWRTLSVVVNGPEYRNCLFLFTCHLLSHLVPSSLLFFSNIFRAQKQHTVYAIMLLSQKIGCSLLSFQEHNVPCLLILRAHSSLWSFVPSSPLFSRGTHHV